jgi:hypothetical protein
METKIKLDILMVLHILNHLEQEKVVFGMPSDVYECVCVCVHVWMCTSLVPEWFDRCYSY